MYVLSDFQGSKGRIIAELNKEIAHSLEENFTYKRPYGFVLQNKAFKGLKTWKHLYMLVLEFLKEKDNSLFKKLPAAEEFISKRGSPLFSHDENALRVATPVNDFYAEVNLSSNGLIKNIQMLLDFFNIPSSDIRIYLREDRDA
ncbi:MAG: hypothetical protein PF692_12410 [Kiritimatiellae bacterium]|nr:hypothetical protein [Kiritimatiellia bacterium]